MVAPILRIKRATRNRIIARERIVLVTVLATALLLVVGKALYNPNPNLNPGRIASTTLRPLPLAQNDCLSRIGNVRNIRAYSQNDEDGGILQTLRCMGGHGTKEYFEFGSEAGTEVNTRLLRDMYGWHGHLLDGSNENLNIPLHREFFTPSNIISLLQKYEVSKNLDVLSVDTDYDDLYITREILLGGYRPRVLINEFNVNLGSELSVSTIAKPVGKESSVYWGMEGSHTCYQGASAMAMINLAKQFGYTPVYANLVNLIFVRLDQAQELGMIIPSVDNFPGPYTLALHANCSGRDWKLIAKNITKAADTDVSHTEFANSFDTVKLFHKDFVGKGDTRSWRIFQPLLQE